MVPLRLVLFCVLSFPLVGTARSPVPPLPEGAVARLGDPRFVVPGWNAAVALSPDCKLVATGDGDLFLWDADTGKLTRRIKAPERVHAFPRAWSRDGRLVASVMLEGQFTVFDLATGAVRWSTEPRPVKGEAAYVTAVRFIDGDRRLAAVLAPTYPSLRHGEFAVGYTEAFTPPGWRVVLWDAEKGTPATARTADEEMRARLKPLGDDYGFCYVALSPSGERTAWLASPRPGAADGKSVAFIHETKSGKFLRAVKDLPRTYRVDLPDEGETLVVYPVRPEKLEKIATGKAVVVGISDGRVRFEYDYRFLPGVWVSGWDPYTVGRVFIERSAVRVGDALLSFDGLGMTRRDWNTGRLLDEYRLFFNQFYTGFAASADGKRVVVREGMRVHVCDGDLTPLRENLNFAYPPEVSFLPDGRLTTLTGTRGGDYGRRYWVWDARRGTRLEDTLFHPPPAAVNVHGGWDASGRILGHAIDNWDLALHDLAACERRFTLKGPGQWLFPSGDGRRALLYQTGADSLVVKWFDGRTGKELGRHEIPNRDRLIHSIDYQAAWFAADGSVFGYRAPDDRLALVNCVTGRVRVTVGVAPKVPTYFAWRYTSAGFDRLIVGSIEQPPQGEYALWDREGNLLRRFVVPLNEKGHWYTRLSPDGRTLATYVRSPYRDFVQKDVALYETATGLLRGHVKLPGDPVLLAQSLDFSPDGKLLATSHNDTTVLLWDIARPLGGKPDLPAPKDAEKLWELLAKADPRESDRALWALVRAPDQALPVVEKFLRPVPIPDAKLVQKLIDQLASEDFATREKAEEALRALGPLTAMQAALKDSDSPEQRRRLAALITRVRGAFDPAAQLRELRGLEVLERIGTPEAKKLVEAVAGGHADTLLTREAKLVLARWPKLAPNP